MPIGRSLKDSSPSNSLSAGVNVSGTLDTNVPEGVARVLPLPAGIRKTAAAKRERGSEATRPNSRLGEKKRVRFSVPNSDHIDRPTPVGIARAIRQGRVRQVGDHLLPAEHRVLSVCKAVEHSCSIMEGHALRSTISPIPVAPKAEDRVSLLKRAYKAHHLVQRGGALWSPHHALMHGPSCEPLTST